MKRSKYGWLTILAHKLLAFLSAKKMVKAHPYISLPFKNISCRKNSLPSFSSATILSIACIWTDSMENWERMPPGIARGTQKLCLASSHCLEDILTLPSFLGPTLLLPKILHTSTPFNSEFFKTKSIPRLRKAHCSLQMSAVAPLVNIVCWHSCRCHLPHLQCSLVPTQPRVDDTFLAGWNDFHGSKSSNEAVISPSSLWQKKTMQKHRPTSEWLRWILTILLCKIMCGDLNLLNGTRFQYTSIIWHLNDVETSTSSLYFAAGGQGHCWSNKPEIYSSECSFASQTVNTCSSLSMRPENDL